MSKMAQEKEPLGEEKKYPARPKPSSSWRYFVLSTGFALLLVVGVLDPGEAVAAAAAVGSAVPAEFSVEHPDNSAVNAVATATTTGIFTGSLLSDRRRPHSDQYRTRLFVAVTVCQILVRRHAALVVALWLFVIQP
ncbi:hypothetical protein [Nocardia lijiangensis]|uniref:hypothetical protein n=1 Tax=Nocardia lijiangensis TaxID=299618 RepID=UPI003D73E050